MCFWSSQHHTAWSWFVTRCHDVQVIYPWLSLITHTHSYVYIFIPLLIHQAMGGPGWRSSPGPVPFKLNNPKNPRERDPRQRGQKRPKSLHGEPRTTLDLPTEKTLERKRPPEVKDTLAVFGIWEVWERLSLTMSLLTLQHSRTSFFLSFLGFEDPT